MYDLSFIIVSYNTKKETRDCIQSVYNSSWNSSFEIIVIDNNSTDGSVQMIRSEFPEVKLIVNDDNKLFAKANNQGAKISQGRWLLLLNSDTLVYDDNIQRLLDFADSLSNDCICVGPKVLNIDYSIQSQGFYEMSHYALAINKFKIDRLIPNCLSKFILPIGTYNYNKDVPHEVGWVVGAAMLVKASLYKKVGGLNENLEFYGEEPEFGYRTKKMGYRTIYYPCAELIHLGGQSTKNCKYNLDDTLRRYGLLVRETVGYKYAITTTKITRLSLWLKYLIKWKPQIKKMAQHESKVIKYLKMKCKESTKN